MRNYSGLTLIELVLVLAILAILTAIAIPAYTGYVQKSRRSDAMSVLSQLRVKQEEYRLKNPTYSLSVSSLDIDATTPGGYYNVSIPSANAGDFTAEADPTGAQSSDACGTFAIDSDGPITSGGYASATCWRR